MKRKIVCLCGSTRFYPRFQQANYEETMAGNIVLSVGFYPHAQDEAHGGDVGVTPEQKEKLDALHLDKIDMADEVLVLNVDGYIGESTNRELAYAIASGKHVRWHDAGHGALYLETHEDALERLAAPLVQERLTLPSASIADIEASMDAGEDPTILPDGSVRKRSPSPLRRPE